MSQPDLPPEIVAERPLLPFLPLVYVAWADGELDPEEIAAVRRRIAEAGGLDPECQERLDGWLDPARPPSARRLQAVLRTVRTVGAGLGPEARESLAGLGAEMARSCCPPGEADPVTREVRQAQARLEEALGIAGGEAVRGLLAAERPRPPAASEPPPFEPARLQALLDAPYGEVRERLKAVLAGPEFAYRYELPRDEYRGQVLAWCRRLAEHGFGALALPPEHGGEGDTGRFIAVFETLALHDQSLLVKFGVQFGLFAGAIEQLGTARHHRRYLAAAGRLELPGCFAMSETGHGSNVADLATTARYLPASGEFEIHTPEPRRRNRKDWIGNAARDGRLAVVFAQLEVGEDRHGVHAFLVPIRGADGAPAPGVTIEDCGLKEGLNGVDNGRLAFDRVRVPRDSLLDRFARVTADGGYESEIASPAKRFFTMLGTLVGGRVSVAAASLAAARSALAVAVRYAARRRQFGPAGAPETRLLDYRSHQRRLLPRLARNYALTFAHRDLVRRFLAAADGAARREVETLAAGIKAAASWHAIDTLQECREACGGQGYLVVNRIPVLREDCDVYATFEGDNTVLMQLVAKGCLTAYRHQFEDLRFSGLLRILGERAARTLAELDPVTPLRTEDEHLLSADFHRQAAAYREDRLLTTAAGRLKRRIDDGMDSFEAFNDCQNHLLALARAHVERLVLERFGEAVEAVEDEALRRVLERLYRLHALATLEADRGWFLENGTFAGAKAKAIRDLVTRLCDEVRADAVALVDAFGIPDALLAAPIALDGEAAGGAE